MMYIPMPNLRRAVPIRNMSEGELPEISRIEHTKTVI
jgi:hypothetical protein